MIDDKERKPEQVVVVHDCCRLPKLNSNSKITSGVRQEREEGLPACRRGAEGKVVAVAVAVFGRSSGSRYESDDSLYSTLAS